MKKITYLFMLSQFLKCHCLAYPSHPLGKNSACELLTEVLS